MASKISEHFDALIIGSSLAGLLHALQLQKDGLKVGIIDSQDQLGGPLRSHVAPNGAAVARFPVTLTATPKVVQALEILKTFLPELEWTQGPADVLTLDSGELRPFVGFGKNVPEAVEIWSEMAAGPHVQLNLPVETLVDRLAQLFTGTRYLRSQVTTWDVLDKKIDALQINGRDWLKAAKYYFAATMKDAITSRVNHLIPARTRQKWSKAKLYSSVGLFLQHGRPAQTLGEFLLQGGGEDNNPCFGFVAKESSVWLALMPSGDEENYDLVYQELKKIKRLAKRACPEAFIEAQKDVVVVQKDTHGWLEDTDPQPMTFDAIQNLTFMMPDMWPGSPLAASLQAGFSQILCAQSATVLTQPEL
jgi:hypothetical protein